MSDWPDGRTFPHYTDPVDLLQFMPLHFSTYDNWKELRADCPNCGWVGYLGQAPFELFRECAQVNCPQCPNELALISYPTRDEAVAAGDEATIALHDYIEARHEVFEQVKLQSVDQLPDIADEEFVIKWVGHEQIGHESYLELRHDAAVIHREPMYFEDSKRYGEICTILKAKYGDRLKDVLPDSIARLYLFGDTLTAVWEVEKAHLRLFGRKEFISDEG